MKTQIDPQRSGDAANRREMSIAPVSVQTTNESAAVVVDAKMASDLSIAIAETIPAAPTGHAPHSKPTSHTQPDAPSRSRWARILGLIVLRVCPTSRNPSACPDCSLLSLCRCARRDFEAGNALEQKIWAALALCGGAATLYAIYCFAWRN